MEKTTVWAVDVNVGEAVLVPYLSVLRGTD